MSDGPQLSNSFGQGTDLVGDFHNRRGPLIKLVDPV